MLKVSNLNVSIQSVAILRDLSLEIPNSTMASLVGRNGAGKTTLLKSIMGLLSASSGKIAFNEYDLIAQPTHLRSGLGIGYMPEERGLYKTMKVGEQCLYLAQLKGLSKQEAKHQLDYWFDRLEIQGWWDKKIQELSKGMAQKIQFVVTVLHKPKLLILDEPFSGFDPVNANLIKDEIIELNRQGTSVIFSTHRMESVEEMCDYIALIHKSNKLIEGKLTDVKKQFRTNSYEVGILSDNIDGLMYDLSQKFTLSQTDFKSLNDELKLEINLGNAAPNDLLNTLVQRGQVTHFVEKIPSMNDIFIQTVTK